jgi:hypothetical protein
LDLKDTVTKLKFLIEGSLCRRDQVEEGICKFEDGLLKISEEPKLLQKTEKDTM